jgi:hypothetical protein
MKYLHPSHFILVGPGCLRLTVTRWLTGRLRLIMIMTTVTVTVTVAAEDSACRPAAKPRPAGEMLML